MTFSRSNEFERNCVSSGLGIEDEFARIKAARKAQGNNSPIVDKIKASMGYSNAPQKRVATVAEMVADLMERTGLGDYHKEVQAFEATKQNKTAQTAPTHTPSLIDVPGVQEAITAHVKRNGLDQNEPVLAFVVNELKPDVVRIIKENSEFPDSLIEMDPYSDGRLVAFVSDVVLGNKEKKSLHDYRYSTPMNAPLHEEDALQSLRPSQKY